MLLYLAVLSFIGIVAVLICLIYVGRNLVRLIRAVEKDHHIEYLRSPLSEESTALPDRRTNSIQQESTVTGNPGLVPRQIVHDLNNLIGTISGFAGAAIEDLPQHSSIRSDLVEIAEASARAKRVVEQLSAYTPGKISATRPSSAPSSSQSSDHYKYPPVSKPVMSFRRTSEYPPPKESASPSPSPLEEAPAGGASSSRSSYLPPAETSIGTKRHSSYPPSAITRSRNRSPSAEPPVPKSPVSRSRENWNTASTGDDSDSLDSKKIPVGTEHLLIVDDEAPLLRMLTRFFMNLGYKVTTFSDSGEALQAFHQDAQMYDMAIVDQRMPEMSGAILAAEMLEVRPDLPIVLLSGYTDSVTPADVQKIGIRRFLTKPVPQVELGVTIRKVLDEQLPD